MIAYIYLLENRTVIDHVPDVISISNDQIDGNELSIGGIDTSKAGIMATDEKFDIGQVIPEGIVDYKSQFMKKTLIEENLDLKERIADIELALAEIYRGRGSEIND